MKDLFTALGLNPRSDDNAARARLSAQPTLDPDSRAAITEILLHPERRAIYLAAHRTARQVAALRAALGVEDTNRWRASVWADFALTPEARRAARRALRARIARPYWWRAGIISALIAIALITAGIIKALS